MNLIIEYVKKVDFTNDQNQPIKGVNVVFKSTEIIENENEKGFKSSKKFLPIEQYDYLRDLVGKTVTPRQEIDVFTGKAKITGFTPIK